jgi:citrate synthase
MKYTELKINGKIIKLPIIDGTMNEKGIDITNLRKETGFITLDPGYQNTGSCSSEITFIDGEKGILRYRGIPIEELCEKSTFIETAYLLIWGKLPNKDELSLFSKRLTENAMLHEDMLEFLRSYPPNSHPMGILSSMVNTLSIFYPHDFPLDIEEANELIDLTIARLISKIRTIAAFSYKKSIGEPYVYPDKDLAYCANFLNMMFNSFTKEYILDPYIVELLNKLLIIHEDHEQNCSTSTVRLVGSSKVNLYSSICAGICALWGPLHGGANQKVIEMLMDIAENKISSKTYIEKSKDKNNPERLMGFGHRIYRTYDPRAKILKDECRKVIKKLNKSDKLLDIALELEEHALKDDYFIERNLYPNVDFYSGIIYRAIGIPTDMFTVMFAIGRLPGWIAQWKEMHDSLPFKIGRPRQIYTGKDIANYIPMNERK